jgi:glycosyltransferase involved in cell wall biosynthesis
LKVVYFGTYERDYPRNAHTIALLRRAGIGVVERHESVWEGQREAWRAGARTALRLARAELRLARRMGGRFDAAIVGYPGHLDVLALKRALPETPLILNPLVSLSDTLVGDRHRFGERSLAARALARIDELAFRGADVVVADTGAHAERFTDLGAQRVEVCPVGADERIFHPPWQPEQPAHVLFVGKLIPLHGVGTIVEAARGAADLLVRVIGDGQERRVLAGRSGNVRWERHRPYASLGDDYRRATVALGIFGTSAKAQRVVPNKAFHALACGTPLVTADTRAARELLTDGGDAALVPAGDAAALAAALRDLAADAERRRALSSAGLATYRERASEAVLAVRWREIVEGARR